MFKVLDFSIALAFWHCQRKTRSIYLCRLFQSIFDKNRIILYSIFSCSAFYYYNVFCHKKIVNLLSQSISVGMCHQKEGKCLQLFKICLYSLLFRIFPCLIFISLQSRCNQKEENCIYQQIVCILLFLYFSLVFFLFRCNVCATRKRQIIAPGRKSLAGWRF